MNFFWTAQRHYNGLSEYKEKLTQTRELLSEEKLKAKLANEEFLEYQQDVATMMPRALPMAGVGKPGYPLRNLAAVLMPSKNERVKKVIIKTLFERGQKLFRDKKYSEATKVFEDFVHRYSYSEHAPEAYFLWLDASFKLGDYPKCVELSHDMVELFPGTDLTGFALLRLGRIYEAQGRAEDAVDIYKTVMRSFPQHDVSEQARVSLRGLDL